MKSNLILQMALFAEHILYEHGVVGELVDSCIRYVQLSEDVPPQLSVTINDIVFELFVDSGINQTLFYNLLMQQTPYPSAQVPI